MDNLVIDPLRPEKITEAVGVLAQAFVTNPLHIAAFGSGEIARNEAFFRMGLGVMRGPKRVITDGSRILGLIHWVDSPGCRFHWYEKLRMAPAMSRTFGVGAAWKVSTWLAAWAAHEPMEPHCHLGPIGVAPDVQGRHVGLQLMDQYCDEIDRKGLAGYLETDRAENVRFYRRFGFEMHKEADVLGVHNYFMWRDARAR